MEFANSRNLQFRCTRNVVMEEIVKHIWGYEDRGRVGEDGQGGKMDIRYLI